MSVSLVVGGCIKYVYERYCFLVVVYYDDFVDNLLKKYFEMDLLIGLVIGG